MQQSPTAAETKPTARHTPGPWAAQLRNGVGRNRNASTINGMQIRSSNGLHVASVTVVADKPIDQKEADAHLIAAAPDLYAALKLAEQHIEHMAKWIGEQKAGYSFESLGEDMPSIRAAIAKAEGR